MKALLLTVLIILVILVVLIFYLNQYTIKKPVVKEQFYGGGGDVYSLQSGTSEFETITKLESDVSNIIVKQEQNTADLSSFKTDTTNQFSTLNTGLGQFKTDASNKLSVLQETSDAQGTTLDVYGNNINDLTSGLKGANDKIAVVDGKLVSITTGQQQNLNQLNSDFKKMNDTQTSFYGIIDNKKQEALKYTDDSISKLSSSLNKSLADEAGLINNTNTQLSSLLGDYNKFKADTSKLDGDQQATINSILTKASTLNDAINAAQNRINDVAASFKNYISQDQLGNFVLKADLQPYATQNQLQNYSLKTDSANFITLNELNQYVKKTDNKPTVDSLAIANNSINTLNSQVKNIQGDYVPKATLGSYVTTENLKPTVDSLNAANAALQNLSTTVSTVLSNYVTKADLPKLAMDATGTAVLSQALDGMKNAVGSLSNTIAEIKSSLSNYVLQSDWKTANANFALKTDLSGYVPNSQLPNYYTKKENDTISGNINSQIAAINTNITQNVASKNDLKGYVQTSQLPQWPTKADIDALTANFNSQISTIKAGTSQILDTMQINKTLKTDQIIATKGLWNTSMPGGWTGGVHTMDLYGEGTVAAGTGGNINAYMNSAGNAKIGAKLGVGIDPGAMGGQTFRVDTPTADWQAFFHNPKGERNALFSHGDGYGMHINTNDQRGDHYSQQLHNGKWVTKQVNNDGLEVNSAATGDWAWRYNNQNGARNIYAMHGDGYGMHINPNDNRGDRYALQTIGAGRETLTVFNDGQKRWNNRSGNWTHFDHPDENGKNYIRGPTQVDAPYLGVNGIRLTQGWTGYPDNAPLQSEISNDPGGGLMIVGNRLNDKNKPRTVGVWDVLNVNGTTNANGQLNANGNVRLNGTVTTPNNHTWGSEGRQHISAGEILYLLPKSGVQIGKEWGGTGSLNVQGDLSTGGNTNISGKLTVSRGDGNWNWLNVVGNQKDQLLLGSDNGNRGIWAAGDRNFSVYNQGTPGLTVDTVGNTYAAGNQIKFSKGWTGYPDNVPLQSEISNDPGGGLMIVGNRLNDKNKPRTVGVWDVLNVNGTTNANGQLNANGNVRLNGTVTTPNNHTWGSEGRQHISAGEILYLLPKNGITVGKEWGGTGDLRVQGQIDVNGPVNISGKWRFGDTGDDWLRVNAPGRSDGNGYYGGVAAGRLWTAQGGLAGSDSRMKDNVIDINKTNADNLLKLNPKAYTYKDDKDQRQRFGFIAQDVEKVYPNMVSEGANGMKSLNYDDIIPLTVANIKDLKQSLPDKETLCLGDVCINKEQLRQIKYALESKSKA